MMDWNQLKEAADALLKIEADAAKKTFEGQAGGGAVKVHLGGNLLMQKIEIDPALMRVEDRAILEDLIVAAYQDAWTRVRNSMMQFRGGDFMDTLFKGMKS